MRALLSVSIDRYTYLTHICCQAPCHRQYSTVYTHSLTSGERCVLCALPMARPGPADDMRLFLLLRDKVDFSTGNRWHRQWQHGNN